jgi:hypothetical protein
LSRPAEPILVKLVVSLISSEDRLFSQCLERLTGQFGPADYLSRYLSFAYTDYYESEMGEGLRRRFVSFRDLIAPDSLPDAKLFSNDLEEQYAREGKRQVNLDPGYLTEFQLILATGKRYAHRPYLRKGIYADLTLIYQDKAYRPLEWTYPDYAGPEMGRILEKIRKKYLLQVKECHQMQ